MKNKNPPQSLEQLLAYVRSGADMLAPMAERLTNPGDSIKLKRFPRFTKAIGGFRPREFTILCGSTGAGKTTLLSQWSADLVAQKIPQLILSVETGPVDFMTRVASVFANKNLNTGEAIPLDETKYLLQTQGNALAQGNLHLALFEDRVSVESLVTLIRHYHANYGVRYVAVDNLNFFMEITRAQDAVIEMDRVVHELILLCKQIDVHVVMVCHPKKTENTRVLSEFDVKGSSLAVQEAHNVILFNRPDPKGTLEPTDRELLLAKCRRVGKYVYGIIPLRQRFDGAIYDER